MQLTQLFPYALGISNIERQLTSAEKIEIEDKSRDVRKNHGNYTTVNTQILDLPEFANLKKDIEAKVVEYFKQVYDPEGSVQPVITLSWLNYTEKLGFHHKHNHPNSLISGVFYINTDPNSDQIQFYDSRYDPLEIVTKTQNKYNSKVWHIPVKSNDLILFPSQIEHGVPPVEHDFLRISLAFNVWVKGTIGTDERLTTLVL